MSIPGRGGGTRNTFESGWASPEKLMSGGGGTPDTFFFGLPIFSTFYIQYG